MFLINLPPFILSKRRDSKDWEEYLLTQDQAIFQRLDGSFGPNILLEKPQTKKLNKTYLYQ